MSPLQATSYPSFANKLRRASKLQAKNGFALIELLVVIFILALLATTITTVVRHQTEKAKVATTLRNIEEVRRATMEYLIDTGRFPPTCDNECTAAADPLLNSLGVFGWNGPYFTLYNSAHPWGGHIGIINSLDITGDGVNDLFIILNDDRPGTPSSDNGGLISLPTMNAIDKALDNGNLTTGTAVRGNGNLSTAPGEMVILVRPGPP